MLHQTDLASTQDIKQEASPANIQAETLLLALHNIIVPIAQRVNGATEQDTNPVSFGTEAEEFLTALQKFIAYIIHSQSNKQDENQADKEEDVGTIARRADTARYEALASTQLIGVVVSPNSVAPSVDTPSREESLITAVPSDARQPAVLTKMLGILRQHVFDTMPIRLLRFRTHRSKFDITLVEREQIYADLAVQLQAKFDDNWAVKNPEPEIINDTVSEIARYSILSHTWLRGVSGEVTYNDWLKGDFDTTQPGYRKLVNFCKTAADHDFVLGWMDTVCINKASSAELDESIRSMYKWYGNASICITYLAATTTLSAMNTDPWFKRGWTLQELIAPKYIKFYGMNWNKLVNDSPNDKTNPIVLQKIESAAMVTHNDMIELASVPISRKMQWAARREVTRGEDAAYSLMGIFNVNIPIAYGEGPEQAFLRLVKEILNTSKNDVIDTFNWAGGYETKDLPLLPSSPKAYLCSYPTDKLRMGRPMEPLTLTHLGLRIPVVLLLAAPTSDLVSSYRSIGDYHGTVNIQTVSVPEIPHSYNLLDVKVLTLGSRIYRDGRMAFAILNCPGNDTIVYIPKTCFAVAIAVNEDMGVVTPLGYKRKISTEKPIIFQLYKKKNSTGDTQLHYVVEKKKLAHHGMQHLNMIL